MPFFRQKISKTGPEMRILVQKTSQKIKIVKFNQNFIKNEKQWSASILTTACWEIFQNLTIAEFVHSGIY